jgi:hypothetical protein
MCGNRRWMFAIIKVFRIAALLAICPPARADPGPIIHYAPAENLDHVEAALIDTAQQEIDLAACGI